MHAVLGPKFKIRLPLPRVQQCPPGMIPGANGCVVNPVDPFPPVKSCPPGLSIGPNGTCVVNQFDPLPPPPFCGGNSGVPCSTTGFEGIPQWSRAINRGQSGIHGLRAWDNTRPTPPDLRSGLFGPDDLGAAPTGATPDYVCAGTRLVYTGLVNEGSFAPFSDRLTAVRNNLMSQGVQILNAKTDSAIIQVSSFNLTIDMVWPIDMSHLADVQSVVEAAVTSAGYAIKGASQVAVAQDACSDGAYTPTATFSAPPILQGTLQGFQTLLNTSPWLILGLVVGGLIVIKKLT